MLMKKERESIVEVGMTLFQFKLVQMSGGNFSIRDPKTNLVAIKPSGIAYNKMRPEDVIIVDLEGEVVEGELAPSIETQMHTGVYKNRNDINAVVHCHAPYTIAWTLKGNKYIPTVTVSQYYTNGAIKIAPLAPAGSPLLAEQAVKTLGDDFAIGLMGHGLLSAGPDMKWALEAALVCEDAARISCICELMGGPTQYFDKELGEMEGFDALARIKDLI